MHRLLSVKHSIRMGCPSMLRCRLCGRVFKDKVEFGVHLRLGSENSCPGLRGMTTCPVCDRVFKSEGDLRKHLRMSMDDTLHECYLMETVTCL